MIVCLTISSYRNITYVDPVQASSPLSHPGGGALMPPCQKTVLIGNNKRQHWCPQALVEAVTPIGGDVLLSSRSAAMDSPSEVQMLEQELDRYVPTLLRAIMS